MIIVLIINLGTYVSDLPNFKEFEMKSSYRIISDILLPLVKLQSHLAFVKSFLLHLLNLNVMLMMICDSPLTINMSIN